VSKLLKAMEHQRAQIDMKIDHIELLDTLKQAYGAKQILPCY